MRNAFSKARDPRGTGSAAFAHPGMLLLLAAALLAVAAPTLAEHTRWWRQTTFEEFDKGTAKGVALRSDGKMFLAPRFAEFADANLAYLLQIRADSKGNLYAAGGSNAKVLRIDASGKSTNVFESSELAAQALAVDAAGNLFVGTSPDGKVYKVTPAGQSSVFFDPKTKYIWDLAVDKDGTLYVATGDTGKIFSVAPDGKGQVFYSSEETHIRSLAFDANANVLAGTEPSGRVLRIPKAAANRRAFVLYETSKKEITTLLEAANGDLYVAAVGEKTTTSVAPSRPITTDNSTVTSNFVISLGPGANQAGATAQAQPIPFTPLFTVNSSSVYRIAADGSPEELWSARDDIVYSMGLLPGGKLLLGTGNDGAVLELEGNHVFSRLVKPPRVRSRRSSPGPAANCSSRRPIRERFSRSVPIKSPKAPSNRRRLTLASFRDGDAEWWGECRRREDRRPLDSIYARSGNTSDPNTNWSDSSGPYSNPSGDKLESPAARFVQWKAVLHGAAGPAPAIDWFNVAYLPRILRRKSPGSPCRIPASASRGFRCQRRGSGPQIPAQVRMPQPPPSASSANSAFSVTTISNLGGSSGPCAFRSGPAGLLKRVMSLFCGPLTTRTTTSWSLRFTFAAKMRLRGNC